MPLSVNRLALLFALVLLVTVILQGCSTSSRQQAVAVRPDYCIGRLAVTAHEPVQFLGGAYQFYWGDIDTWREDEASYRRRVLAAQAPVDGACRPAVRCMPRLPSSCICGRSPMRPLPRKTPPSCAGSVRVNSRACRC